MVSLIREKRVPDVKGPLCYADHQKLAPLGVQVGAAVASCRGSGVLHSLKSGVQNEACWIWPAMSVARHAWQQGTVKEAMKGLNDSACVQVCLWRRIPGLDISTDAVKDSMTLLRPPALASPSCGLHTAQLLLIAM